MAAVGNFAKFSGEFARRGYDQKFSLKTNSLGKATRYRLDQLCCNFTTTQENAGGGSVDGRTNVPPELATRKQQPKALGETEQREGKIDHRIVRSDRNGKTNLAA